MSAPLLNGPRVRPNGLTFRQERFIAEYAIDGHATRAAIRAGYRPTNASDCASNLLRLPKIQQAIEVHKAQQFRRADLTAARILEELRRVATFDPRSCFTETGNLKPIHELTGEQASSIAAVDVVKRNLTSGDGSIDTVYRIKFWDKLRALELLAKHFGLLVERLEAHGTIHITWGESESVQPVTVDVTPSINPQ